ncbi:MAG: hypothetical protein L0206_18560 [Actinobacteria bacterium]|nr:hypothetical protein [Actinomycetota bacterium]
MDSIGRPADCLAGIAGVARMYEQIYELSPEKTLKGEALVGMPKAGHPDIQRLIARASEDPDLVPAAATARIHHARLTGLFGSREVTLGESGIRAFVQDQDAVKARLN